MTSHGTTSKDWVITKPLTAFFTAPDARGGYRFPHHAGLSPQTRLTGLTAPEGVTADVAALPQETASARSGFNYSVGAKY